MVTVCTLNSTFTIEVSCIASVFTQFLMAYEHFNSLSKQPLAIYPWWVIVYVWNGCSKPQAGSFAIMPDLLCLYCWYECWHQLAAGSIHFRFIYLPKACKLWTNSMRQSHFVTCWTAALKGASSSLSSDLMLDKEIRWDFKRFSRIASFTRRFWIRSQSCIRFLKELSFNPVQSSGHYMYHQFNIQQFYVLPTQCIYVFCVDLRTDSYYFPIQH